MKRWIGGIREKINVLIAYAIPARLAYWVAIRVVTHASITDFEDEAFGDIKCVEALKCWHESKIK